MRFGILLLLAAACFSSSPREKPKRADGVVAPAASSIEPPPVSVVEPVEPPQPPPPKIPTAEQISIAEDLSKERSDGGPPSEPLVAKKRKVTVAEVEAADQAVQAYRAQLETETRAKLQAASTGSDSDHEKGIYKFKDALVGFTGYARATPGLFTANMFVMVRRCNTASDFAERMQTALQTPIPLLPLGASGYFARVGYNDEWSCTGWLDREAIYDRAQNGVTVNSSHR